jgi:hypothetical protein
MLTAGDRLATVILFRPARRCSGAIVMATGVHAVVAPLAVPSQLANGLAPLKTRFPFTSTAIGVRSGHSSSMPVNVKVAGPVGAASSRKAAVARE